MAPRDAGAVVRIANTHAAAADDDNADDDNADDDDVYDDDDNDYDDDEDDDDDEEAQIVQQASERASDGRAHVVIRGSRWRARLEGEQPDGCQRGQTRRRWRRKRCARAVHRSRRRGRRLSTEWPLSCARARSLAHAARRRRRRRRREKGPNWIRRRGAAASKRGSSRFGTRFLRASSELVGAEPRLILTLLVVARPPLWSVGERRPRGQDFYGSGERRAAREAA